MLRELPKSELDVMKVIWANDGVVTSKIVSEGLKSTKEWARTTTLTILARLVDKGFLQVDKTKRLSKYTALINKDDYITFITEIFVAEVFDGNVRNLRELLNNYS